MAETRDVVVIIKSSQCGKTEMLYSGPAPHGMEGGWVEVFSAHAPRDLRKLPRETRPTPTGGARRG